jgi:hypothetical protein
VALGATFADRPGRQGIVIGGVRFVAGTAIAGGERGVLYRELLPCGNLVVAAGAQVRGIPYQQLGIGPAVRKVAVNTAPLCHRLVHNSPVEFLHQVGMTGETQRAGTVLE